MVLLFFGVWFFNLKALNLNILYFITYFIFLFLAKDRNSQYSCFTSSGGGSLNFFVKKGQNIWDFCSKYHQKSRNHLYNKEEDTHRNCKIFFWIIIFFLNCFNLMLIDFDWIWFQIDFDFKFILISNWFRFISNWF